MSEKFKRGCIVTNKNGDEFDCKVVILVTGDRSTSDHHFSGVCIHTYNKKIHPVGDFSTTWHLNKFVKLHNSLEEWLSDESPAEQPVASALPLKELTPDQLRVMNQTSDKLFTREKSAAEQPVLPTFWDVAKAFKWAAEYSNELGEQLVLSDGQWTIINGDDNESETQDLTFGNVAELYCLQEGYDKAEQSGREVEAVEFHDWVEKNRWEIDHREQHTHTTAELYKLFKEQKEK